MTRPAQMQPFHYRVETPKKTEYPVVFASSASKAKQILEDRYFGQSARITPLEPKENKDAQR
jgi:hypothetical protein